MPRKPASAGYGSRPKGKKRSYSKKRSTPKPSPVSLADIRKTSEYQELLLIGMEDITSKTKSKRPEMLINVQHKDLGEYPTASGTVIGNYTIFQTGYIRFYSSGPHKVIDAIADDHAMNLDEWKERLLIVWDRTIKNIMTTGMGLPAGSAKKISARHSNTRDWIDDLIKTHPQSLMKWIKTLTDSQIHNLLIHVKDEVVDAIHSNPSKWVFTLKEIKKLPIVKRIVGDLNPGVQKQFRDDLDLAGDLHDLGF